MNKELLPPRATVAKLKAYDPGAHDVRINLSANENPYDVPEGLKSKILEEASRLAFNRYPDPAATGPRQAIAAHYGVDIEQVAVGNGGDELILALLLAYGGQSRTAVTFEPTFVMYRILAELTGTACRQVDRRPDFDLPEDAAKQINLARGAIVFVCSPNNPTGNTAAPDQVVALLEKTGALVLVDEAYQEFSRSSVSGLVKSYPNLVVLRTFSKAFSLAGLRVGYMIGSPEVIANIFKVKLPYNVNVFSQAAAGLLMKDRARFDQVIEEILTERERVFGAVGKMPGLIPYPSSANFILVKSETSGKQLWRNLLSKSILVRDVSGMPGLSDCLRITVGTPEQNDALIKALSGFSKGNEHPIE